MSEESKKALEEWWKLADEVNRISRMKPLSPGGPVPTHTKEEISRMLQLCEEEKKALQRYLDSIENK
ncbi:MAG: hypothetical protein P9L88_05345 [Candidatus Tantalella remota]|nr:hypothetical protein [Candidatus Tantalella remota]